MAASKVGMSIDEFLDHSTGGGGRSNFLGNWRKKDPPKITVWLHTQAGFVARWVHNWPRIVVRQDKDTGDTRREVWGGQWVCHERELILRKQRFRDENDVREYPPEVCPLCKTIEIIRSAVATGELSWVEPVFKFTGDNDEHEYIITAGGLYNAFAAKDLTPAQKGEMRRAGIKASEAWRENAIARCQYTFVVVDNAHPENGVQLTDEAEALGNAMKRAIRDKIDELGGGEDGRLKGNPLRNPYPFLWEYREQEMFEKRYRVVPMSSVPLTDEIRALIDEEPPDLAAHARPGNIKALRADMEKAALVDLPWDDIFGEAERRAGIDDADGFGNAEPGAAVDKKEDDFPPSWNEPTTPAATKPGRTPEVSSKPKIAPKAPPPAPPAANEELFACDHCGFDQLRATDAECPKCKSTYSEDGRLETRPCAACGVQTPANGEGNRTICPKCATIHDTETWQPVNPTPAAAPAPARRSRSAGGAAAPAPAPAAAPTQRKAIGMKAASDDKLPWGSR